MIRLNIIANATPLQIIVVYQCGNEVPLSRVLARATIHFVTTLGGFYF